MYDEEQLIKDAEISEKEEVRIFFDKAAEFYNTSQRQGQELYHIAFRLTNEFRDITSEVIQQDPRIIKILRYMTIPALSQMKVGQLIALRTTAALERGKKPTPTQAQRLAEVFERQLDHSRLVWHEAQLAEEVANLAKEYAKRWTASLMANQNATTRFRNWRKDIQEAKIAEAILEASYELGGRQASISGKDDLLIGTFVKESKVKGSVALQKADFVIRLKDDRLMPLEAKAIGVRIDAYKRIKEVRDKKADWEAAFGDDVITGAVVAGFVPISELETLISSDIPFFWEHRLEDLTRFLEEIG